MPIYKIKEFKRIEHMIKSYSNNSVISNGVNFILKAAKKRRMIAMDNAKEVQLELGIAPALTAVK